MVTADLNFHRIYTDGCDRSCPLISVVYTLMLTVAEYSILATGFTPSNSLVGLAKKKSKIWVNSETMLAR